MYVLDIDHGVEFPGQNIFLDYPWMLSEATKEAMASLDAIRGNKTLY